MTFVWLTIVFVIIFIDILIGGRPRSPRDNISSTWFNADG
jgi:hypothetical protein